MTNIALETFLLRRVSEADARRPAGPQPHDSARPSELPRSDEHAAPSGPKR